jgi:CheY-like chemotaxis protein
MSADNPPVVLLVEDEPLLRLVVSDLLIEAECRVVEAANAAEALAVLEAGVGVEVLLADVDMPPGINGYELAQQVHAEWPQIEILITSGRAWPGEGDLPAGAAFLAKPVPNEALVSHIAAAADRARADQTSQVDAKEGADNVVPFPKLA